MKKSDAVSNLNSCWNKAKWEEHIFILLERDKAASSTIRHWISKRIELGLNKPDDKQLVEAEQCAKMMEENENCH